MVTQKTGHDSKDGESHSSAERRTKKKEVSTPTYGKRMDRLKSIINSCEMSVPPSVYKKVKQVSEDKCEAYLMKELEEIFSREGLSDKEIKEVKKREERAKEPEGIDMSNIVSSSRRGMASRYVAPPKPEIPAEGNGEEAGDSDADNGRDDDVEDEDEDDDGNDESQSDDLSEGGE